MFRATGYEKPRKDGFWQNLEEGRPCRQSSHASFVVLVFEETPRNSAIKRQPAQIRALRKAGSLGGDVFWGWHVMIPGPLGRRNKQAWRALVRGPTDSLHCLIRTERERACLACLDSIWKTICPWVLPFKPLGVKLDFNFFVVVQIPKGSASNEFVKSGLEVYY